MFQQILNSYLLSTKLFLFQPSFLFLATIIALVFWIKFKEYKNSAYYQLTKTPYLLLRNDIGKFGEYHTYKRLKKFEKIGAKFLFNVYIPKDNDETSEIDILMICPKGLFVFESKNYSGWIFGNENHKTWYQTLPKGRGRSHKEPFYNPIMQNRSHIKHLVDFLGEPIPTQSIIVFSERCTLKNVQIKSKDIPVINRYDIANIVHTIYNQSPSDILSENDIMALYNKLYPLTQIDSDTKEQHIKNIQDNLILKSKELALETNPPKTEQTTSAETENKETPQETVLVCPKCKGELVLRKATKGQNAGKQFYGCSNFPKCKYIKNL